MLKSKHSYIIIVLLIMAQAPVVYSGSYSCAESSKEIHGFLNGNEWFWMIDKQLEKKHQLILQYSDEIAAEKEVDNACQSVEKVMNILVSNDFQNANFANKAKRCEILEKIAKQAQETDNELNQKLISLHVNIDELTKSNQFITIGNKSSLITLETNFSEHESTLNSLHIKRRIVSAKSLGGDCGEVELNYIMFSPEKFDKAKEINDLVNEVVKKDILTIRENPLDINNFLSEHFKAGDYSYHYNQEVDFLDEHVFSFNESTYTFSGGAHGNTVSNRYAFDLRNHELIQLEDIFSENDIPALMSVARLSFMQDNNLDPTKSWDEQGYWFGNETTDKVEKKWISKDKFYLPKNFSINNEGITFLYQSYEITNYANGTPGFLLRWKDVIPFLKKDSVGRFYI